MIDIIKVEQDRRNWSVKNFPQSNAISGLNHAEKEIKEIREDIAAGEKRPVEYADAIMCLVDSAACQGITLTEIFEAYAEKVEINKSRTWEVNEDGSYSHVKEA